MDTIIPIENNSIINQFFENSLIGLGILDEHGNWEKTNTILNNLLGYHEDELIGTSFISYTHAECKQFNADIILNFSLKDISSYKTEIRFIHKNGSIIWVILSISKFVDNATNKFICQLIDITESKRTNTQLLEEQLKLKSILKANSTASIIAVDKNEIISIYNKGSETLLGYTEEEVIGKMTPVDFHIREEMEERSEIVFKHSGNRLFGAEMIIYYAEHKLGRNEWTYKRKDGSTVKVQILLTQIFDEHKNPIGFIGVCTDLSEINYQIKQLEETTLILDAIVSADMNAMIIASDKHETTILYSKSAEITLGYSAKDMIGDRAPIYFHDNEEVDSRNEILFKKYGKYFFGAEIVKEYNNLYPTANNEWTFIKKDGTKFPVHLVITSIHNKQNELVGHIGIATDISQSKKYQKELENINAKLKYYNDFHEKIGSLSPSTIYVYNIQENRNVYNNEAISEILGYTPQEIINMGSNFMPTVLVDEYKDITMNRFNNIADLEYDEILKYEYKVKHKDGTVKWIYAMEKPFSRDEKGNVLDIIGVGTDITDIKNYQTELIEKNKELEQFAYIASHDLQEPLRTVSSFTKLLIEENKQNYTEQQHAYAYYIEQSVSRMKNQIEQLLKYSRIGIDSNLEEIDVKALIYNIKDDLKVYIEENNAQITCGIFPKIKAYKTELRILFQNLIHNAIKFRKKDSIPEINIQCKENESNYEFSIADNGIGINSKYFERIFLIFQQLDTDELKNGSGIGLAHCKKIVNIHKGNIWVESVEGKGSTFYFTIPKKITI